MNLFFAATTINDLAKSLGDACFGFLGLNFVWGLYNVIMGFRRVRELNFGGHDEQAEYVDEIIQHMKAGDFAAVEELTNEDLRGLPQLINLAVTNRELKYDELRQVVMEIVQRDVMGDLEYRVNWIATSIKCGPLLGLFGTVLGMMAAFGRIGTGEKVEQHMIAAEISIALICTAMGLGTAIPFNFMLASLTTRIRNLQDALGAGLMRVLDFFKPHDHQFPIGGATMHGSGFSMGSTGAEELMSRRPSREQPEFDIVAMVDLVFMMNIYFLVTFVGASALNLPAAKHVVALDADEAVIFTVTRSLDGKGATLYVGDNTESEPINDVAEQEQRIRAAVEEGVGAGKKYVLMKAERKVRMADFFRISSLAVAPVGDSGTRLTLHDAVMEKDE